MDKLEYIENLESTLIDILDGNSSWWNIKSATGLPDERCQEIETFFPNTVMPKYMAKHNL
jgi:hypothetical protein